MSRHLNPTLFDASGYESPVRPAPAPAPPQPPRYPDPHSSDPSSPLQEEMPDFGPDGGMWDRGSHTAILRTQALNVPSSGWEETIVPTWKLKTGQGSVYRPSVDHLKENSEGHPNVRTVKVGDDHHLTDGNHRALAAKEMGKLFVWSNEYDASRE